jgi:glutaredoxin 3
MPDSAMLPVEVYTTRFCPYCSAAKALLKRKGISYSEIDVSRDFERREETIHRAIGQMSVPAGSIRCWPARARHERR